MFSAIETHGHMRIVETSYKTVGKFGSYEVKMVQVKGLRLRKKVLVKALKKKS